MNATALSGTLSALDIAAALGQHAPTPEQVQVIEAPPEPLLVVAGAGSGKTETMAARVVWLVANGVVTPDRVLGLTFTRKAAGELSDRIRARLRSLRAAGLLPMSADSTASTGDPQDAAEATVSTYHAYAAAVVADHGLRVGVEPGARLIGEAAAWQIATEVVESWDDLPGVDNSASHVTRAVLSLAAECAEHLVDPDAVDAHLADVVHRATSLPGRVPADLRKGLAALTARRSLVPLLRAYADRKRALGVLDHGDQVAVAARVAAAVPVVVATERSRWGVVLLDEYQDTSTAQAQLLVSLFGRGHPVTAVGDPHQSIYGWRGASAGGLDVFPRRFAAAPGRPARVLGLSTSWRNDVAVLSVAAVVAEPLRQTSPLPLPRLGARGDAGRGRVRVRWCESAAEEADEVATALAAAWRADERAAEPGAGVQHRSMAVLCRKRSQFGLLEHALRARDLPVEVVGVGGLLSRPEVADVVAVLRAVHDPGRGDAVLRLVTGARWRLGPRDLAVLAAWSRRLGGPVQPATRPGDAAAAGGPEGPAARAPAEDLDPASLADAVEDLPPPGWTDHGRCLSSTARVRLEELAALLRRLRAASGLPLPDLVVEAERALGLDVEVGARAVSAAVPGSRASDARADLDALADVAESFAADAAPRPTAVVRRADGSPAGPTRAGSLLGAFLAWLDAAAEHERGLELGEPESDGSGAASSVATDRRAVQLLTVHAAKGLEWDVVAVPGLAEGTFPTTPRTRGGWLTTLGSLPYALRGDAASLPVLRWEDAREAADLERGRRAFIDDCADHALREERRLAYVAITRARTDLLLTGSWWGPTGSKPRDPSPFLREVHEVCRGLGGVDVGELTAAPREADNPSLREPRRAVWPADPLGADRAAVEDAAAAVRAAVGEAAPPDRSSPWAREVDVLLAEREARADASASVALPAHLSASRLVQLAADPAELALAVRRPVPTRPREATRRGTLLHAWLEERFRSQALLDLDDPHELAVDGDPDDALDAGDDSGGQGPSDGTDGTGLTDGTDIAALRAAFLASEWADRSPLAVEVDLETPVAGLAVRCRVDAVFGREDGGVDVVDWKTGAPPTGERARAAAVQLAVYRLAWARLHHLPLEAVHAAFFYAAHGQTTRPVDLMDAAALEALVTALPVVAAIA